LLRFLRLSGFIAFNRLENKMEPKDSVCQGCGHISPAAQTDNSGICPSCGQNAENASLKSSGMKRVAWNIFFTFMVFSIINLPVALYSTSITPIQNLIIHLSTQLAELIINLLVGAIVVLPFYLVTRKTNRYKPAGPGALRALCCYRFGDIYHPCKLEV